nr:hypothetical protein GCM10025699_60550 [Microbacterium flavescens]
MSDAASNLPAAPGPNDDELTDSAPADPTVTGDVVTGDDGTEGIATGPGAGDLDVVEDPLEADAADDERFSPLHDVHVAAGASFTDFAGWQMPVRYSSDLAEHHAVRSAAGLFDLSHMAEIAVTGPEAGVFLDRALAGTLSSIAVGRAKYSLLLSDTGGILDDLVVYRLDDHDFLVVANAGNRDAAFSALATRASGFDVTVDDESDDTALIAIQGPESEGVLDELVTSDRLQPDAPLSALRYYRVLQGTFDDAPVLIARTGYTGEDGFEIYLDPETAPALWTALAEAGAPAASSPRGSPAATRSGSRRGCPSTVTSSVSTCGRPRRVSVASSTPRRTSWARRASSPPPTPACSSASPSRVVEPLEPATRWSPTTAPSSARSPAARSRPPWATPSPWRSSTPTWSTAARPSRSTCAARRSPRPSSPSRSTSAPKPSHPSRKAPA